MTTGYRLLLGGAYLWDTNNMTYNRLASLKVKRTSMSISITTLPLFQTSLHYLGLYFPQS